MPETDTKEHAADHRSRYTAAREAPGTVTFLPEPDRRARRNVLISVDDHVIEPPTMFSGRVPAALADRAPRVVETAGGTQEWDYDGSRYAELGFGAMVGRPVLELGFAPQRFEHMRRGAWDPIARVHDMDLAGVYASVNFPSGLAGFGGQRLQLGRDPELARAVVRAWNDWHIDEWAAVARDRFIPCQIPWLLDPVEAAAEVVANAARGFRAMTFPEAPHLLGLPSLHTGHWDPLMRACEETETVVCLHVGSASASPRTAEDAPPDVTGALFFAYSMFAAVDWLYSLVPVRFPGLKISLAEGGLGWVPGLLDRLDHMLRYHQMYGTWQGIALTPAEVLARNFWFCALNEPSIFQVRHRIGVENMLVEVDYPHLDSSWPDCQEHFGAQVAGLPDAEAKMIMWENASALFRHPVPPEVQGDPDAYGMHED